MYVPDRLSRRLGYPSRYRFHMILGAGWVGSGGIGVGADLRMVENFELNCMSLAKNKNDLDLEPEYICGVELRAA
jgi:hypothetical protein